MPVLSTAHGNVPRSLTRNRLPRDDEDVLTHCRCALWQVPACGAARPLLPEKSSEVPKPGLGSRTSAPRGGLVGSREGMGISLGGPCAVH